MEYLSLRKDDTEELQRLWNLSADHDPLTANLLAEKIWEDPDYCEPLGLAAKYDGQLVGMACSVVRQSGTSRKGYVKLLAVHPNFQGRGFGKEILKEAEKRLLDQTVEAIRPCESAPNYLYPGIDVRYTKALLLFESLGYEKIGVTYNLEVDLLTQGYDSRDNFQQYKREDGITIRRATDHDQSSLETLLDQHWASWNAELEIAMKNDPASVFLALMEDKVIGFAAYDCNNLDTAWFGPMGTDPDYRGRGIGAALLHCCLSDLKWQGHFHAIIPWVGPVKFYARHVGAQISRVFHRYEKKFN